MKARISALACFFVLTGPLALDVAGTPVGPLSIPDAQAQDQVTDLAREKFKEGVAAYDSGKYEQARTAFLQAYALKRHPAVLLNLGQSELKSGYTEDAGNHLQQFLRDFKQATPDQKKAAEAGVQEAQRKTGFAVVIVDADKATVAIDGRVIGESPLLDPYFVTPGSHKATATIQGRSVESAFDAKRGSATPVVLTTGVTSAPPPTPVPTPVPTPTPTPSPNPGPGETAQPPAYQPPPPPGGDPGPMSGPPMGPGPADTGVGRENFFHWYPRKPIAWVGTGLTGLGLVGTIVFIGVAADANSQANTVTDAIKAEQAKLNNVPDGRQPCGPEDQPEADLPHYAQACSLLRDHLDTYDGSLIGVGIFAGVTVLAAGGTVLYYFLDSANGGDGSASLTLQPMLGPETQGLGLTGTF